MGKKILLIDDSDVTAEMVSETLVEAGFQVVRAVNGVEGIIKAYNEIPDLIIMDAEMPLLKGYQASRLLKSKRGVKDIPIIMHTTLSEDKDQYWSVSSGIDGFIVKDFNHLDNLVLMVKELSGHPPYRVDIIKEDALKMNRDSILEMLSNLLDTQLFQSVILNELADIGRDIESLPDTVRKILELVNKVCEHNIIVIILNHENKFFPFILPYQGITGADIEDFYRVCLGDFYQIFDKKNVEEENRTIFEQDSVSGLSESRSDQVKISSYICLEIKGKGGSVFGTLHVGHSKNNYFSESVHANLSIFSKGSGIILENSILLRQISSMEKNIRSVFSKFVPEDIIDDLLKRKTTSALMMGETRNVAVLFSDIRSFTSISENNHPENVVSFLNAYLDVMCRVIVKNGGTIDKFIGDAILAVFGAPKSYEDNDFRAVQSAIEMIESLKTIVTPNIKLPPEGIDIGIGIHGGNVIVGNIGSRDKFDYTVIGDTVNLASRLGGLTKHYKQKIIISDAVMEKIKHRIVSREIDTVKVLGKDVSTTLYGVEACNPVVPDEKMLKSYNKGLSMYKIKNWKTAIEYFKEALNVMPDDPVSKIYISRCEGYIKEPPPDDWDGAIGLDFK